MPKFLLQDKINYQGLSISYKVSGNAPDSANPLFIVNLPPLNFSSRTLYPQAQLYAQERAKLSLPEANMIFIDYPGSGESSKPIKPEEQYSLPLYAEIVAQVIEEVRRKLDLNKMQLVVQSAGDQTMVAMSLPTTRPKWTQENSPIRLRMLINRFIMTQDIYPYEYLQTQLKNDPNLPSYLEAVKTIYSGNIKNYRELNEAQLKLAPLFIEEGLMLSLSKLMLALRINSLIQSALIPAMRLASLIPINQINKMMNFMIENFQGCNLDALNHFARTLYDGFNTLTLVEANRALYEKLLIVNINSEDFELNPSLKASLQLKELLPDNVTEIILSGRRYNLMDKIVNLSQAICAGKLNDKITHIADFHSAEFEKRYKLLKDEVLAPPVVVKKSSTAKNMSVPGPRTARDIRKPIILLPESHVIVELSPPAQPQEVQKKINTPLRRRL